MSVKQQSPVDPADIKIEKPGFLVKLAIYERLTSSTKLVSSFSLGGMLLAWFVISGPAPWPPLVSTTFLPSPVDVFRTFLDLAENGYQGFSIWHHIFISFSRFMIAFVFCIVVGVPLGMLMGMNRLCKAIFDPIIEATRPIPKLALLPLMIIWLGIGELPKVTIIILALFPMMTISAMQAVTLVSAKKIQAAYSLGATPYRVFKTIYLPGSLPGIFTGIRMSVGVGVTMLVGAEMIATNDGVAWMALSAADFLLTSIVINGILIMAFMGMGIEFIVRWIESRLVHWGGKEA